MKFDRSFWIGVVFAGVLLPVALFVAEPFRDSMIVWPSNQNSASETNGEDRQAAPVTTASEETSNGVEVPNEIAMVPALESTELPETELRNAPIWLEGAWCRYDRDTGGHADRAVVFSVAHDDLATMREYQIERTRRVLGIVGQNSVRVTPGRSYTLGQFDNIRPNGWRVDLTEYDSLVIDKLGGNLVMQRYFNVPGVGGEQAAHLYRPCDQSIPLGD